MKKFPTERLHSLHARVLSAVVWNVVCPVATRVSACGGSWGDVINIVHVCAHGEADRET